MVCEVALLTGRQADRARRLLKAAGIPSIAWPSRMPLSNLLFWPAGPFRICVSQEHLAAAKELLREAGFAVEE
jgi:hypothetical protein